MDRGCKKKNEKSYSFSTYPTVSKTMEYGELTKYPVINFSKENLVPGSESWISICKNVKQAFEDHGFFVAIQDGFISEELSNGVFQGMEELFDLPKEIKVRNTSDTIFFFGYQEPNSNMPLSESSSIEESTSLEAVENFTKLMWSSGNNNFRDTLHLYATKVLELRKVVNKMVFESYGLEKYYDSCNKSLMNIIRMMKYWPPITKEAEIGAGAHSDKNWITILEQNQVNGLQIKPKNEEQWISVDLPRRSLVVFAGDALTAWSNGRIHAAVHRVLMHGKETRYSLAQFSYHTEKVQVPEELVDDDHPLLYKPFDNFGLVRFYATAEGQKAENLLEAYCGV